MQCCNESYGFSATVKLVLAVKCERYEQFNNNKKLLDAKIGSDESDRVGAAAVDRKE